MGREDLFSIRQMVELTGLSEFTIRGWENRYAAFSPARGETGRRGYLKSDIERALLLRELLKRGYKIGKIASLGSPRLKTLFEDSSASASSMAEPVRTEVQLAMELMALQKWTELHAHMSKVPHSDPTQFIHDFVLPALKSLAMQVATGMVSISQEHIFSSLLKERIYFALSQTVPLKTRRNTSTQFVLAAPEGDFHEVGLLIAHLLIRGFGFPSLYIGAHTPAVDLAETALRFGASHLLIVSTISKSGGARQDIFSYVSELRRKVGERPKILLAGNQVPHLNLERNAPLFHIANFEALESYLQSLNGQKSQTRKR